jgi:hypothetical protein
LPDGDPKTVPFVVSMIGYAVALSRAVPSRTIWLVVAPLLAGASAHGIGALRRRRLGAAGENAEMTRLVGAGSLGLAAGAFIGHVLVLARGAPGRGALVQSFPAARHIGDVEVGLTLCFDVLSAAFCGLAVLTGVWLAGRLAARSPEHRPWMAWARLELGLAGTLVAGMADDVPTMAFGWAIASAAAAWLAASRDPAVGGRVAARAAVAMAALVAGGAWLFCGTGGFWSLDDASPSASTKLAVEPLALSAGESTLRMVSWPGAVVFLDDAHVPLATAPFVGVEVPQGHHELRVRTGEGLEENRVEFTVPPAGETFAVEPSGSTLSFRELAVGLSHPDAPLAHALAEQHGAGFADCAAMAFCAWLVAVCAIASIIPRVWMLETGVLGPVLLARAAVLAPLVPIGAWAAGLAIVFAFAFVEERRVPEDALERTVARGGRLLLRFERWVVDATASAGAALFLALAWSAAWLDARVIGAPLDAVAVRVGRAAYRVEPAVGGSLARAAWLLLFAISAAAAAASYAASR